VQPRQGDVRGELAALGGQPHALHGPLDATVQLEHGCGIVEPRPQDPRLAARREHPDPRHRQRERRVPDAVQRVLQAPLGAAVDLADEAHRDVELVALLPAGVRDASAHQPQVVLDLRRQVDPDEQPHEPQASSSYCGPVVAGPGRRSPARWPRTPGGSAHGVRRPRRHAVASARRGTAAAATAARPLAAAIRRTGARCYPPISDSRNAYMSTCCATPFLRVPAPPWPAFCSIRMIAGSPLPLAAWIAAVNLRACIGSTRSSLSAESISIAG